MGWGDPWRSAKRESALRLAKGEARGRAAADDLVAAAVADRAALEVELAAERARADRMAHMLETDAIYDPAVVLAEHHAARAEAGR